MSNSIEIYQGKNGEIEFKSDIKKDTIWANKFDIAKLFNIDRSVVSRHIKKIFNDNELDINMVCAKFAHTTAHGAIKGKTQTRKIEFYNLDIILAIGYKTNSIQAIQFRKWTTSVLKKYLTDGYVIDTNKITHQRFKDLENNVSVLKNDMQNIKSKIKNDTITTTQGIFYNGQIYDAYVYINDIFKTSQTTITLIDNYIDDTVLTIFSKYPKLQYLIITKKLSKQLELDISKYNSQYNNLKIKLSDKYHDRFLIIDNKEVYHIGASLKDLGKKIFAFSKIDKNVLKDMLV